MKQYNKEQTEAFSELAERLNEMTEQNDHTGVAYLLAASLLTLALPEREIARRAERCFEIMEVVRDEHKRLGHLPRYLSDLRYAYLSEIMEHLERVIDNEEVFAMIRAAL